MAWLLCVRLLTFDFPISNGPDGFTVMKATAAAADIKVTELVMRRIEVKRLRLNQRGIFIFWSLNIYVLALGAAILGKR